MNFVLPTVPPGNTFDGVFGKRHGSLVREPVPLQALTLLVDLNGENNDELEEDKHASDDSELQSHHLLLAS